MQWCVFGEFNRKKLTQGNDNLLRSMWTGVLRGEMNGEAGGD